MKRVLISGILLIGFPQISALQAADEAVGSYTFRDQGKEKQYQIDLSSSYTTTRQGTYGKTAFSSTPATREAYFNALRNTQRVTGANADMILYPVGKEGEKKHLRILKNKLLLTVEEGTNIDALRESLGAKSARTYEGGKSKIVVLGFADSIEALEKLEGCKANEQVLTAEPLLAKWKYKNAIPNDPRFLYKKDENETYQWHLYNTGENGAVEGIDANVVNVWDEYTGAGVTIAIADDGLEVRHPDLMQNVNTLIDHNWNDGDPDDPSPVKLTDTHGTNVGGVAGARWNNSVGVTGSAPEATLVGLRFLSDPVTDEETAEMLSWRTDVIDVHNDSWGYYTSSLIPIEDIEEAALLDGINNGRGGLGTIYLFAAGNFHEENGNANYQGITNSRYSVTVGAINDDGRKSYYSNPGCSLTVSAPSNGSPTHQGITTTTSLADGQYTDDFGGTSSATPLTSGIVALILEANPNLGWRDVQEILITSARKVNSGHADWQDNAGGFHFHHDFGAGMVDAEAAVTLAKTWVNLAPQTMVMAEALPGGDIEDVGKPFDVNFDFRPAVNKRVEHVEVRLLVDHTQRADLECVLISPAGTESRLTEAYNDLEDEQNIDHIFVSNFNWGENSSGVWKVRLTDKRTGNVGTVQEVDVMIYGVDAPEALPPSITSRNRATGLVDESFAYQLTGNDITAITLKSDLPAGLVWNGNARTISGTPTEVGIFQAWFEVANGVNTLDFILTIAIGEEPQYDLAGAIEQSNQVVTSNGAFAWLLDLQETSDGSDAVSTPWFLPDYGESELTLARQGSGVILFDWKVSSEEGFDRFFFYPNGGAGLQDWAGFLDGDVEWGTFASKINSPSSTPKWSYMKDSSQFDGLDQAFLDRVRFVPIEDYPAMLAAYSNADTGLTFGTDSKALWLPTDWISRPDGTALRSSTIGNGQHSDLVAHVQGPGRVSFSWKVSSDRRDFLQCYLGGAEVARISGETEWDDLHFDLGAGEQSITWRYVKDISGSGGLYDSGLVDSISFEPFTDYDDWASTQFTPAELLDPVISGPDADPNNNQSSNLIEYAFGGNPLVVDGSLMLPGMTLDDDGYGYTFRKNYTNGDLTYQMEQSTDLENWVVVTGTLVETDGEYETYRYRLNTEPGTENFLRVRVIQTATE